MSNLPDLKNKLELVMIKIKQDSECEIQLTSEELKSLYAERDFLELQLGGSYEF